MKKAVALLLIVLIVISNINVFAVTDIYTATEKTADYILSVLNNAENVFPGSEWAILGLSRYGANSHKSYLEKYYSDVKYYIKSKNGELDTRKNTEYSKLILVLTALGIDAQNVENYNLLLKLGDFEKTVSQGQNGAIWALIALDSGDYEIPVSRNFAVQANREMYIEHILNAQKNDGGWSLTDSQISDVDVTAMALCALSGYRHKTSVKTAVDKAIEFLALTQNEKGGFANRDGENSESVAQVIIAICELGIPINDSRFIKNEKSVYDNLMTFYDKKGGFYHTLDDKVINPIATEQAFSALVALKRAKDGLSSLYDMSDVEKNNADAIRKELHEFSNRNINIVKKEIVENKTFTDISGHTAQMQIEALASRKIIDGKGNGFFEPDSTITRAECAAIIIKCLGLSAEAEVVFNDVKEDDWFFEVISTAYHYGIITGISESEFNPNEKITKEEMAVILSRAAKICGMTTEYDSVSIMDILVGFFDYVTVSIWAKNAVAFCYDIGIFPTEEMEIHPQMFVTRAEVAIMLYNMLKIGNLL